MTDVELSSKEFSLIIKWYNMIFSANQKDPQKDEIRLFHKLEVLQEAAKSIEDFASDLTK
jgi:hypothetical protein